MTAGKRVVYAAFAIIAVMVAAACISHAPRTVVAAESLDPADWGSDHVGKPMPAYEDGNSCLFCHRFHVGSDWHKNEHQITVRQLDRNEFEDAPEDAQLLLGIGEHARFLKRGGRYGKMDIHADGAWDPELFGAKCAGCHMSGVDSVEQTYSVVALDCHTCHGLVPADHTEKPELALFAKKTDEDPRVLLSICASCHLRGGESKSTGLPYPNNFVPGDNLFKDFDVNLDEDRIAAMTDIGNRHIYENVRDVMILGNTGITCVSCHNVHEASSEKHIRMKRSARCFTCHYETGDAIETKEYPRSSATCQY